jgi:hypothetical protein
MIELIHIGIGALIICIIISAYVVIKKVYNKEYTYRQYDVIDLCLLSVAMGLVSMNLIASLYYGATGNYYPHGSSTAFIRLSVIGGGLIFFSKAIWEFNKKKYFQ